MSTLTHVTDPITIKSIERLPPELPGLYLEHLVRLCPDPRLWRTEYRSLCASLATARAPMTEIQLAFSTSAEREDVRSRLREIRQLLKRGETDDTWQLFHRSFGEFLLSSEDSDQYWCDEEAHHKRVLVQIKMGKECWSAVPWDHVDDYALDFVTWHLVQG